MIELNKDFIPKDEVISESTQCFCYSSLTEFPQLLVICGHLQNPTSKPNALAQVPGQWRWDTEMVMIIFSVDSFTGSADPGLQ